MAAKRKKAYWFKLDSKGYCGHVRDVIDPAEAKLLGAIEGEKQAYEIYQCKVCKYIYVGRLPLKHYLEKASKA